MANINAIRLERDHQLGKAQDNIAKAIEELRIAVTLIDALTSDDQSREVVHAADEAHVHAQALATEIVELRRRVTRS